ncbi:MAG: hypothetical protein J0H12_01115 [Candidatus Paracaedimonas acanthamoebae]|uniref:Uncharacterized protein n=1 Tax=Candidatus Paracaedimonas acanthamoebae TaxID=244581 RepID=A0A8J7PGL0_9PROT|nr:hypothetical protein [Candidatus Paracaedimonas acanthamoebae]
MKNFAQNSSFLRILSVCMIFSGFGINVDKCVASALEEEAQEGIEGIHTLLVPMVIPDPDPFDIEIPKPLALDDIVVPDLDGQAFWHEMISLKKDDEARDKRIDQIDTCFWSVVDLPSMFEEHNYDGVDFKKALLAGNFKLVVSLKGTPYEIEKYTVNNEEFPPSIVLHKAVKDWPALQEGFFSINQGMQLLRERILKLAGQEQELLNLLAQFKQKGMKFRQKYIQLKTVKNKKLKDSNKKLDEENKALKVRVAQLEQEVADRNIPPIAQQVIVPTEEGFSLWRWFTRLFSRTTKKTDEATPLIINTDANEKV